jgi:hypothetical protein
MRPHLRPGQGTGSCRKRRPGERRGAFRRAELGYLDQIVAGLRDAGLRVFHVVLDADDDILRERILGSAEAQQWRLAHLPAYQQSRSWMIRAADLVVDTGYRTPLEAAGRIADALGQR